MDRAYFDTLQKRAKQSRVYQKHQLTGLRIADLLGDFENKALYIRLAKKYNQEKLLSLARDIIDRKSVNNPAAYFMRMVQKSRLPELPSTSAHRLGTGRQRSILKKPKQMKIRFMSKRR